MRAWRQGEYDIKHNNRGNMCIRTVDTPTTDTIGVPGDRGPSATERATER
jgi:hypothetical protein